MILADTSAWIEYDRATGSGVDVRLTGLIAADGELAVTEPVAMEVLIGARNDRRESELRRLLARFELLPLDVPTDVDGAVRIYRRCRLGAGSLGLIDARANRARDHPAPGGVFASPRHILQLCGRRARLCFRSGARTGSGAGERAPGSGRPSARTRPSCSWGPSTRNAGR